MWLRIKTRSVYDNKNYILFAFKEEKKTQHLDIIFQSNHWCYTAVKGHIFVLFAEQGPINKNKVDGELLSRKQFQSRSRKILRRRRIQDVSSRMCFWASFKVRSWFINLHQRMHFMSFSLMKLGASCAPCSFSATFITKKKKSPCTHRKSSLPHS